MSSSLSFDRRESVTADENRACAGAATFSGQFSSRRGSIASCRCELRVGFPRPTSVRIADGAHPLDHSDARRRNAARRHGAARRRSRSASSKNHARVSSAGRAVSDNSHMTHFLTWRVRDRGMAGRSMHTRRRSPGRCEYRPRPRPCVVFRSVGAVRRGHRGWLSDRRRGDPMIAADPYLVVRAASIYVTALLTIAAWLRWKKAPELFRAARKRLPEPFSPARCWPSRGICRSCSSLNVAAQRFGWWQFDAQGGLLLGVPVDFLLAWVWLWSVVPLLAFPTRSPSAQSRSSRWRSISS